MFLFLLNLMIIFLIAFSIAKKRLNLPSNLFIFMIMELLITSYFAVLHINLEVWEITNDLKLFIIFRLYEMIFIPLLYVTYFNLLAAIKLHLNKCMFTIIYIAVLYGVEILLVEGKVIRYNEWHFWQSLLSISLVLFISYLSYLSFNHVLRKEGMGK